MYRNICKHSQYFSSNSLQHSQREPEPSDSGLAQPGSAWRLINSSLHFLVIAIGASYQLNRTYSTCVITEYRKSKKRY